MMTVNYQYNLIDIRKYFCKFDFLIDLSTFTTAPKFGKNGVQVII